MTTAKERVLGAIEMADGSQLNNAAKPTKISSILRNALARYDYLLNFEAYLDETDATYIPPQRPSEDFQQLKKMANVYHDIASIRGFSGWWQRSQEKRVLVKLANQVVNQEMTRRDSTYMAYAVNVAHGKISSLYTLDISSDHLRQIKPTAADPSKHLNELTQVFRADANSLNASAKTAYDRRIQRELPRITRLMHIEAEHSIEGKPVTKATSQVLQCREQLEQLKQAGTCLFIEPDNLEKRPFITEKRLKQEKKRLNRLIKINTKEMIKTANAVKKSYYRTEKATLHQIISASYNDKDSTLTGFYPSLRQNKTALFMISSQLKSDGGAISSIETDMDYFVYFRLKRAAPYQESPAVFATIKSLLIEREYLGSIDSSFKLSSKEKSIAKREARSAVRAAKKRLRIATYLAKHPSSKRFKNFASKIDSTAQATSYATIKKAAEQFSVDENNDSKLLSESQVDTIKRAFQETNSDAKEAPYADESMADLTETDMVEIENEFPTEEDAYDFGEERPIKNDTDKSFQRWEPSFYAKPAAKNHSAWEMVRVTGWPDESGKVNDAITAVHRDIFNEAPEEVRDAHMIKSRLGLD